jgi:hypothetical protein
MSGSSKFAIRLSVEGAQQAGAALKGVPESAAVGVKTLGDASDRTGQKMRGLRADTSTVTPALKGLDNAAKGVGDAFHSIAGRVPVIGGMLQSMGPAGLAAAAGIAAITGAFVAMNGMAQKSREYLDDIATQAANVGTSAETYQTLTALAIEQDIEFTKLAESLNKLQLGAAMAAKGQGELYSTLKRVKPELIDVIATAETQEDRWDALSRAITGTENQLDKVAIAKAAFGEKGAQFIRMLEGEDKSISALTEKYREMGLVIDEELVASIAAADTRLDLANKRMEIDGVRAGAAMLPVIEGIANAWNGAQIALGSYLDGLNDLDKRQLSTLIDRRKAAMAEREKLMGDLTAGRYSANSAVEAGLRVDAERLRNEVNELQAEILRRQAQPIAKGAVALDTVVTDPAEEARLAAEANKRAAEEARKRADAERELAKALAEQAASQARVNAILDAGKTPVQRAYDELDALTELYSKHGNALVGYAEAYTAVLGKIAEAEAAERKLADAYVVGADAFGRTMDAYEQGIDTLDQTREATFELRFAAETLGGIFDQNIETLEDLGAVALRVFRQMAIEAMIAQSKIAGSSLMQIISAGFGMFGGGGASPVYVDPALGAYPGADPSLAAYGQYHVGGMSGMPPQVRLASTDVFANAPRNHRGYPLAADERAVITQVGEPIVAKWDARRIMEAVERSGGSGAGVKVVVNNHSGEKATVNERQSADGGREIEVTIGRAVDRHIASGRADNAMASRYNLRPAVR